MQKSGRKTLVMLIGISGSGKSTYIRKHYDPSEVVCPDDIRRELTGDVSNQAVSYKAWMIAAERIKRLLSTRGRAVLDAVNVGSKDRGRFLKGFPGVEKVAVVFPANPELSKARIAADHAAGVDRARVPPDVIDKQAQKLEQGYAQIAQQFDRVLTPDSPVDEEVWRFVASSADMIGGNQGGMTDKPSVPKGDGSDHARPEGAPEFFRESKNVPVRYTGIVLENRSANELLETFYHDNPEVAGWEPVAHHMTLRLGALSQPKKDKHEEFARLNGRMVDLRVTAFGLSDKAAAVEVQCLDNDVATAMEALAAIDGKKSPWHVTVAVNRAGGGKPVDSNRITTWEPLPEPMKITGVVQEVS